LSYPNGAIWAGLALVLVGCHSKPLAPLPPTIAKTHRLLPEVHHTQEPEAKRQAVLASVPIGMSIDQAQAVLKAEGFQCEAGSFWGMDGRGDLRMISFNHLQQQIASTRPSRQIWCKAAWTPEGDWRLAHHHVFVVLVPDDNQKVKDVAVADEMESHPEARYFRQRPELTEPGGPERRGGASTHEQIRLPL